MDTLVTEDDLTSPTVRIRTVVTEAEDDGEVTVAPPGAVAAAVAVSRIVP